MKPIIEINDKILLNDIQAGIAKPGEVKNWLMRNKTFDEVFTSLAEYIIEDYGGTSLKQIVITEKQFKEFFRIQGKKWVNGELVAETRGAKPKEI